MGYCQESPTATAIPPTSASAIVMLPIMIIGSITFGVTLSQVHYIYYILCRNKPAEHLTYNYQIFVFI